MKVRLELDRNGMGCLLLNGKDFSHDVRGIVLESKVGEIPSLIITFVATEIEVEMEEASVTAERPLIP